MIGSARAMLFARSMFSSMRWNPRPSGSMASIRQYRPWPAYHPFADARKLYDSTVISTESELSRRLEREAGRNLLVMWLLGRIVRDEQNTVDFRKDNGPAIKKVWARALSSCAQDGPAGGGQRCYRRQQVWKAANRSRQQVTQRQDPRAP